LAKYFAYGSNMSRERMRERGVIFSQRRWAKLPGYELVFNVLDEMDAGIGYANIVQRNGPATVEGVLYEICESGFAKLDNFEEVPEYYQRRTVSVTVDDGREIEAMTYIGRRTGDHLLPTREYLNHLITDSRLLSAEYQSWLRTIRTAD
jgi:gamma-glutamylcyclotransferase